MPAGNGEQADLVTNMDSSTRTPRAIDYAWRQLLIRAGVRASDISSSPSRVLDLPLHYSQPGRQQDEKPGIVVVPCDDQAWEQILARNPMSLDWLPASETVPENGRLPFDGSVPALFWSAGFEKGS